MRCCRAARYCECAEDAEYCTCGAMRYCECEDDEEN